MLSDHGLKAESWNSMANRLHSFMASRSSPGKGAIIAVSHESVILSLLSTTLGFDEFTGFSLKLRNASASIVKYGKKIEILGFGMPVLTKEVLKKI
jgi:broad specificity phosphatase PhoE